MTPCAAIFQSTPPARGATTPPGVLSYQHRISIHAPREGGDGWITGTASGLGISIHAPREGGDENGSNNGLKLGKFQSTPPARGATEHRRQITNGIGISIHAPREGGDTTIPPKKYGPHTYFNPRPPRGGRLQGSAGRKALQTISIHAPREGGDLHIAGMMTMKLIFQSTPPARGATSLIILITFIT